MYIQYIDIGAYIYIYIYYKFTSKCHNQITPSSEQRSFFFDLLYLTLVYKIVKNNLTNKYQQN